MADGGATVLDQAVVVDENVITSRFIYDIPQLLMRLSLNLTERQTCQEDIPVTELVVLYRMPNDPERFEKYYREVHGPITSKLPGLKGYKYGPARALDGDPGEFFWYWSGTFDSRQAALDAMASPEGLAGAADVPNYYHDDPLFMFFEK